MDAAPTERSFSFEEVLDHLPEIKLGPPGALATDSSQRSRWRRQPHKGEMESLAAFVFPERTSLSRMSGDPAIEVHLGNGGEERLSLSRAAIKPAEELAAGKARFP